MICCWCFAQEEAQKATRPTKSGRERGADSTRTASRGKDADLAGSGKRRAQPTGKSGGNMEEQSRDVSKQADHDPKEEPITLKLLLDHFKIASFLDVPCGDADQVSSKVEQFPTDHPNDIR